MQQTGTSSQGVIIDIDSQEEAGQQTRQELHQGPILGFSTSGSLAKSRAAALRAKSLKLDEEAETGEEKVSEQDAASDLRSNLSGTASGCDSGGAAMTGEHCAVDDEIAKQAKTRRSLVALGGPGAPQEGMFRSSISMRASIQASLRPRASLAMMGRASVFGEDGPTHMEAEEQAAIEDEEARKQIAAMEPSSFERDELATADASLSFKEVTFNTYQPNPDNAGDKVKVKKTIIEDCWGHFEAGELVAIMGPSGCGKTTLMDILARKKSGEYDGDVYMNGHAQDVMFERLVSYVGQQDMMPQHWKVYDAIAFNAILKKPKPSEVSWGQFYAFIETQLDDVGLKEVQHTKIGGETVRGVSGGQRRRVSLARGIAGKPALMFCDEPTSGLSATDAELVMKTLLGMSRRWHVTIVVVIHQPRREVAELFDRLVVLTSWPGRIVYDGFMKDASGYWSELGFPVPPGENPVDHFLDTVTPTAKGSASNVFHQNYQQFQKPQIVKRVEKALKEPGMSAWDMLESERTAMMRFGSLPKVTRGSYGTSWITQAKTLLYRKYKLTIVDWGVLGIMIGMKVVIALFLGFVFLGVGNKSPRGFAQIRYVFLILQQISISAMNVMPVVLEARMVMKLEVAERLYSVDAHVVAATLIDSLVTVLGNSLMVVILYSMGELDWSVFVGFYLWSIFLAFAVESFLLAVAAASENAEAATSVGGPVVTIFFLFSGLLVSRITAPIYLQWAIAASPFHWVMEIVMFNLYGGDENAWGLLERSFGFREPSQATGACVVMALCLASRFLQIIFLKTLHNPRK